jgi:hypothetical protein
VTVDESKKGEDKIIFIYIRDEIPICALTWFFTSYISINSKGGDYWIFFRFFTKEIILYVLALIFFH